MTYRYIASRPTEFDGTEGDPVKRKLKPENTVVKPPESIPPRRRRHLNCGGGCARCEDVSFPVSVRLSRGNIELTWSRARFIVSWAMAFSKPGYGLNFHNMAYAAFLLTCTGTSRTNSIENVEYVNNSTELTCLNIKRSRPQWWKRSTDSRKAKDRRGVTMILLHNIGRDLTVVIIPHSQCVIGLLEMRDGY
ncbi:hypothetical protein CBL_01262 [Carabus blaptoides fortunei]